MVTNAGQELIASALSGAGTVEFVAVKTSSYAYPQSTNISGLTDLQDIVQTEMPFSAQVFNETMLQVSVRLDNSQVAEAYLIQTLGIYAQIGNEPAVLFAVIQATTPDQMPAQSAVSPSAFIYNIQITVQQATSISVSVNPSGTATVQDILDLQQQINDRVQAIGGNVSDTVSDAEEPGDAIKYPDIPSTGGTAKTLFGYLVRWVKSLKADKVDASGGDINGTKVSKFTSSSAQYPVPVAGDSLSTIMGKVVKFFSDIRSTAIGACYIGQLVSNNTTNNSSLPASAAAVYQEAQLRAQQIAQLNSDMAVRLIAKDGYLKQVGTASVSGAMQVVFTAGNSTEYAVPLANNTPNSPRSRLRYGTRILQASSSQRSQQLLNFAELNDIFGVSNVDISNTIVLAGNGDWNANECQVTTFCTASAWHVGFSATISGPIQINYLAAYWG